MSDWAGFGGALRGELARLEENAVIVLHDGAGHLVQFLQNADHLRAETIGDVHDDGAGDVRRGLLTVRGERLLRATGWLPPAHDDGDHNWCRRTPWPATSGELDDLVDAVLTALRDVRELPSPRVLTYRSWSRGNESRTLDLGPQSF